MTIKTVALIFNVAFILIAARGNAEGESSPRIKQVCEFRLLNPYRNPGAFRYFRRHLEFPVLQGDATVPDSALTLARAEFGVGTLPNPAALSFLLAHDRESDGYLVVLQAEGILLFNGYFSMRPLYMWKESPGSLDADMFKQNLFFQTEDKRRLRLGLISEASEEGRRFLSVRERPDGFFELRLGVDVDCRRLNDFTSDAGEELIFVSRNSVLCRTNVVEALLAPIENGR